MVQNASSLKVMLEGPFAGPGSKRRFEREVELIGSLRHPGIVPIFDSGVAQGQYFYAMEYIHGEPLDEHARNAALATNEILSLFRKVCAAVDYAHQRGVIHRDLKPSNVGNRCKARNRAESPILIRTYSRSAGIPTESSWP